MRKVIVFNQVSLDGFIADANGNMQWAHRSDPEWNAFVAENAKGDAAFLFGRKTYDLMASYWPTPMAAKNNPVVADCMNAMPKVVVSKTMDKASWNNTRVLNGDLVKEVKKLKNESGPDFVIFGSGTIVSQLADAGLIDEYQFALNPIALGKGKGMFDGLKQRVALKLTKSRAFGNGNVFLCYEPAA